MGLLDSLLGAASQAMGGQQAQQGASPWIGMISTVLNNGSVQGGLGGVLQQLQASGLADHVASWVSNGNNLPVSADQITQALGGAGGLLAQLAQHAGTTPQEAGEQLSQWLPHIVDHLSPNGQMPDLGNLGQVLGQLSQMGKPAGA
ncbi:MAG: DUF937 domain-containing protein [Paucibacter sp.]|nr:DUF937 domain-containing protein [Roseateles sp.]